MHQITIEIRDNNQIVLAQSGFENQTVLSYFSPFHAGDEMIIKSEQYPVYVMMQWDERIGPSLLFMKGDYRFVIPAKADRLPYDPKTFCGKEARIWARLATDSEIFSYQNVAKNPYDSHENTTTFPHAFANCETRGEAIFAARNAIDGNTRNRRHGKWPYESWGINKNPEAQLTIDFGRNVLIDKVVLFTRSDFPHDSWWRQADLRYSDGTSQTIVLKKTSEPQVFAIPPIQTDHIVLEHLIKSELNFSPYPALTEIEVYGTPIK